MKRDTWRLGLGLTGLRAPKKSIKSGSLPFRVETNIPYQGHGQALAFCKGLPGRWVSLPAIRNAMAMK